MNGIVLARHHASRAFLVYLALVIYGSLVPFELRSYTLDEAIRTFLRIPYLSLGVTSRADWVANLVLFVPLGFLACAWMASAPRTKTVRMLAAVAVFTLCAAIAVGVEFVQIFFRPRTVSLNDLQAEFLGTAGGIAVWWLWGRRLRTLAQAFADGGRESVTAAAALYLMVYVALSLFPYDVLVSAKEIADKLSSDKLAWLVARDCGNWTRCLAPRVGEVLAVAPLGVLLAAAARRRLSAARLFAAGALLGAVLELAQVLIASGISQGLSVLLRGAGLAAGGWLGHAMKQAGPAAMGRILWRAAPLAAVPYLVGVAAVNGWFHQPWVASELALERLDRMRWMPFYYHYFTSERAAMASLLAQAALYAPVGVVAWARHAARASTGRGNWLLAAFAAAAIALPVELGKLWGSPRHHPDLTNLIIAAASAAIACALAHWLAAVMSGRRPGTVPPSPGHGPAPAPAPASAGVSMPAQAQASAAAVAPTRALARGPAPAPEAESAAPAPALASPAPAWVRPPALTLLACAAAAIALLAGVLDYPAGRPVLALALAAYGLVLHRHPDLWLLVVPAALAALDLRVITGQPWLDEFDLLVLATVTVGYWRLGGAPARPYPVRALGVAVAALWLTWLAATARGLWPVLAAGGDWLEASSHPPAESWRVGKGLLWALLLLPLLRRVTPQRVEHARTLLARGLMLGLAAVVLAVLWERQAFVGLANFGNVFRVTGTFASMHTGGAYIEAFIAFAFPVLAVWVLRQRGWMARLAGAAGAAAASYAMLVTFSRGGYVALLAGLCVVAMAGVRLRAREGGRNRLALAVVTLAALAVAVPVLSGGYAKYRLARAGHDLDVRLAHWARALELMERGPMAAITGMGFGRYPALYLYGIRDGRFPGTYRVVHEDGNSYLRLGAGEPVFLEQLVNVAPDTAYRVSARIRQPDGNAFLTVFLCEKALLYSFRCVTGRLAPGSPGTGWSDASVELASGMLGRGGVLPRPIKLSLHNPSSRNVDVDELVLAGAAGGNLLANGGFDSGTDRWLLVSDQDLAWHIHQQALETYFAQGILGLLALAAVLVAAARALWPGVRQGQWFATAMAAAIASFLTVGLLGSVVDAARTSMLLYLGALAAALLAQTARQPGGPATRGSSVRGRGTAIAPGGPAGGPQPA